MTINGSRQLLGVDSSAQPFLCVKEIAWQTLDVEGFLIEGVATKRMSTEFLEELEALESVYSDLRLSIIQDTHSISENDGITERLLSVASTSKPPAKNATKNSIDKATSIKNLYATIMLYCTPRSSSTSFVSAEIQLSVPNFYPLERPTFKILKSSGLSDDGREIEAIVNKFIEDSPPEECLLFQLICLVYDFLDDCRIGECSICAEEIIEFNFQGTSWDFCHSLLYQYSCNYDIYAIRNE